MVLNCGQQSPQFCRFSFLLIIIMSGRLAEIRWSIYISKSQGSLRISFSRTDSGLCIYHFFPMTNLNFLHKFQWTTLQTQLCLVFYSFCAILLRSLTMWLIVIIIVIIIAVFVAVVVTDVFTFHEMCRSSNGLCSSVSFSKYSTPFPNRPAYSRHAVIHLTWELVRLICHLTEKPNQTWELVQYM